MSYIDGFVLPLPNGKEDQYRKMAEDFAVKAEKYGAIASVEGLGDGLAHGHTPDFFRAVQAKDDENVVFSFIIWPDKQVRDHYRTYERWLGRHRVQRGQLHGRSTGRRQARRTLFQALLLVEQLTGVRRSLCG